MGIGKSYKGGATQANYGNKSGCSIDSGNGLKPCSKNADKKKSERASKQFSPKNIKVKF